MHRQARLRDAAVRHCAWIVMVTVGTIADSPSPAVAHPQPEPGVREVCRLEIAASRDDRAEDLLASLIAHERWTVPHWSRPHRRHGRLLPARLDVDGRLLALLDLGPGGAPDPLSLYDPVSSQAASRIGQDAPILSLPVLRVCTRSPVAAVRAQAALALGWARDPGGEPFVNVLLGDPVAAVRARAAEALGLMDDRAALPGLQAALRDRDEDVRIAAARALGTLGDPAALPAVSLIVMAKDPALRRTAYETIAELGGHGAVSLLRQALADPALFHADGPGALYTLAQAAGRAAGGSSLAQLEHDEADPDPQLQRATVVALGASRDPLAVPTLESALQDPDGQVRSLAADALGEIGDPAAAPDLLHALEAAAPEGTDRAGPALVAIGARTGLDRLRVLASGPDPAVASTALGVLGRLGTAADVAVATRALASPAVGEREAAALALAHLASLPAARQREAACGAWGKDGVLTDADLGGSGPAAVAPRGAACALGQLLLACRAPSPRVRAAAAQALGQLGDRRSFGQLFAMAQDKDRAVAEAARVALGRSRVGWAELPLDRELAAGSTGAAHGLAELGQVTLALRISALLSSSDPSSRGQAAAALAGLLEGRSRPPAVAIARLTRSLDDPDRNVRIQAALTLADVPGTAIQATLRQAARRANPYVRPWFAAASIRQAGGGQLHPDWALLASAATQPDPELRRVGLSALAWLAEPPGVPLALPALVAPWTALRDAAVDVLARTPGAESERPLLAIVAHGHWSEAVRALEEVPPGDPRIPELVMAAHSARDIRVRWAGERLAAEVRYR